MPLQTRIYLYDNTLKPISARDVHARMSMELPSDNAVHSVVFQYVAMFVGATGQDFVTAGFDLTQLQDKETPITVEFSGLADRQHPTASFTPVFSRSKLRPYVAQVLPTQADRADILRQRVCPVTGEVLGSRGPVAKLLVGDYPLYLASEDSIEAVKQTPERFLPRPVAAAPGRWQR